MIAVTHHQPTTIGIDLVSMILKVGGHLGLQRRRGHLPSAVAHNLVQHRRISRAGRVGAAIVIDYLADFLLSSVQLGLGRLGWAAILVSPVWFGAGRPGGMTARMTAEQAMRAGRAFWCCLARAEAETAVALVGGP